MHPELKLLISLQEIDHQLELLAEETNDQKKKILQKEEEIKTTQNALSETEKKEKDALLKLKKEEEVLKEIEYKIDQKKNELFSGKFTNPKELMGFQKEMKRWEEEKDKKETDIILLMEEYEKIKEEVKGLRERSEKVIEKLRKELSELQEEDEKIQKEIEKLLAKREETRKKIDKKHYELYEKIRKEKGRAVVKIKDTTCSGCHLDIPGNVIDNVKENKEIITCPHCGRILFWDESSSGGRA